MQPPGTTRALVFLRSFNDIDHVVPVLHRLLHDGDADVTVAILSDRALIDDPRLALIAGHPSCTVSHLLDLAPDPRAIEAARERLPDRLRAHTCLAMSGEQIAGMLDRVFGGRAGVVVFDWINDRMPERAFVERLGPIAREGSLSVIALPHGDAPYSSRLFRPDAIDDASAENFSSCTMFDAVVVPNAWCQRRYLPHLPPERVPALGSPRYCAQWFDVLEQLVPRYAPPSTADDSTNLRAVLMPRSPGWHNDWTEFERLIDVCRAVGGVRLAIKHHTRTTRTGSIERGFPKLFVEDEFLTQTSPDVSSFALCRWADVVLHTGTSAVTDTIIRNRAVISLEHMCHARTLTGEEMPGTIVLDRDGVADRLERLKRDRRDVGYSQNERSRYLARNVTPAGGDVLGRYAEFLRSHASGAEPPTSVRVARSSGAVAVVPARMGSSRFPGKPLALIRGMPMVLHCLRRAERCDAIDRALVATCDEEIARCVRDAGGEAIMTSPDHERATDRIAEAVDRLEQDGAVIESVVLLQGDEPLTTPGMIEQAIAPLRSDPSVDLVNLTSEIRDPEELSNPNVIKVVADGSWNAMYMSRAPIPTGTQGVLGWRQVCVMGFRRAALAEFARLEPTPLERAESIDMLRWLEHARRLRLVPTAQATQSVDTPEDLELAERLMESDGLFGEYASRA